MSDEWDDAAAHATGETMQVACFGVGAQEYAIDIMRIKEIVTPVTITPVPRAPAFVEGIITLRGAFLPVVDLRKRFGVPASPMTRESKYVVVTIAGRVLGLVVDRVIDVRAVDPRDVAPPPELAVGPDAAFVSGCVEHGDGILLFVDLDAVLSGAERAELLGMETSR